MRPLTPHFLCCPLLALRPQELHQMLYAMKVPVPASAEELADPKSWRVPASPFVLDIGANVGWFMINAAAHGATVAAFEGRLPWQAAGCVDCALRAGSPRSEAHPYCMIPDCVC